MAIVSPMYAAHTNGYIPPRTYLSRQFYERVKLSETNMTQLAAEHGLRLSSFSRALHRTRRVTVGDKRYLAMGKKLGLKKAQIFDAPTPAQRGAA
jgi:hypothetical protein